MLIGVTTLTWSFTGFLFVLLLLFTIIGIIIFSASVKTKVDESHEPQYHRKTKMISTKMLITAAAITFLIYIFWAFGFINL